MKSSSVNETVEANRYFSVHSDTPLHLGITATGPIEEGIIKSAMGIGALLLDGIGDTIRVSLTGDSLQEVKAAVFLRDIVSGQSDRLQIISCPTCSRKRINVRKILDNFVEMLEPKDFCKPLKVAIMGCEVNGPGEAKACDIGICGTDKGGIFIREGKIISSFTHGELADILLEELRKL